MCDPLPGSYYACCYRERFLRNHHEYEYVENLLGKEIFVESAAGLGRGLRGLSGALAGAWGFLRPRRAGEAAG